MRGFHRFLRLSATHGARLHSQRLAQTGFGRHALAQLGLSVDNVLGVAQSLARLQGPDDALQDSYLLVHSAEASGVGLQAYSLSMRAAGRGAGADRSKSSRRTRSAG